MTGKTVTPPTRPLRAVLVGCGSMARKWLGAVNESPYVKGRVEIVGLVDLDEAAARNRAEQFRFPDALIGTDLDSVLAATKPDILFDVVVPAARRTVVETGLRHGCHVLSEKPMASSLEEARHLIAAAAQAQRVHAVVQNRRFVEGVRRIERFLREGGIGRLTALHCDFFVGAHFGGFREEMQHVLLLDMAIHTLDAARFMSGKTPLSVYCEESNPPGSWYRHGAAANALFRMSDDVVFTYRGSWTAEGANTSWEGSWRFVGTKGTLLWDGHDGFSAHVVTGGTGQFRDLAPVEIPPAPEARRTEGHASVIADFLDALETGTAPETAATDNINSLAMVFAAIDSAKAGTRMNIEIEKET
ncbi:Gfo/Idh/MocA family protein [Shinella sp.]|uniref:Gfo/Idh/MocA family protein n=1 Tax=Shinella sp. TaxID=1870904 RepID=UPI003F7235DB